MDAVAAVEPIVDEIPVVLENTIKVLQTTSNIIVIDAKDLKTFAIRAAVVAAYGGVAYWSWKAQVKPWLEERKLDKKLKDERDRAAKVMEETTKAAATKVANGAAKAAAKLDEKA